MSRDVPEDWRRVQIGDIAREISERNRNQQPIPVLSVTKYDGFVPSEEYFSKTVYSKNTENYKVVRRNQFAYATIHLDEGSIDILRTHDAGMISPMYTVFRVDDKQVDREFLFRLLKHFASCGRFDALGNGGVNRRKSINFNNLAKFSLDLPPLSEQRRIAEILSSVDEAIQATQDVVEQTRKVKQGVLTRLLTKGIGHTRFKQTEIGEIPEGWEIRTLEEISLVERGKFSVRPRNDPRYYGGSIPFVQTGDVTKADGELVSHSQTLNEDGLSVSKLFPAQSILITIAANIGDTAITTYPVCCPDSVVAIQPSSGTNVFWLREFLETQKGNLDRQATRNAQKNINLQHLKPIRVPTPPREEQDKIGEQVNQFGKAIRKLNNELRQLTAMKSALMSDLLTGRKRVSTDLPMAAE